MKEKNRMTYHCKFDNSFYLVNNHNKVMFIDNICYIPVGNILTGIFLNEKSNLIKRTIKRYLGY